jgi:hypothetical protein
MSWTGFYLGGGGGIGWADIDVNARRCGRHLHVDHHEVADVIVDDNGECDPDFDLRREFNEDSDGEFVGIVQGGFDWEVAPSFVVGVMASGSSRTLLTRETSTTMTASLMNSVDAIASSPVSTAY